MKKSFIAPDVHDLGRFAKTASPGELMMEIQIAVSSIEHPDVRMRARRTMSFLDDMPKLLQGVHDNGFFMGFLNGRDRAEHEPIQ